MNDMQRQEARAPVEIRAAGVVLQGSLAQPPGAEATVLFAHGSGSSRLSPRNRFVAGRLNEAGLGTLLFDLLTAEEDDVDRVTRQHRFNIPLLAQRLAGATDWLFSTSGAMDQRVGYFGASTGSAAALIAAAERPDRVRAVVSRGGRVDMAESVLPKVEAPTLCIVGGNDAQVLELNRRAMDRLRCPKRLAIVEGATHLFEEPGALEEVAQLAAGWFSEHLAQPPVEPEED